MVDSTIAQSMNLCFFGMVAAWRISLLHVYFLRVAGMRRPIAVVATLLPVLVLIACVAAVHLEHRVFSAMVGLPPILSVPAARSPGCRRS